MSWNFYDSIVNALECVGVYLIAFGVVVIVGWCIFDGTRKWIRELHQDDAA